MKLILNEREKELNVPQDTPSLWAIREELGDESIKFGCGKGLCGACTILVDGEPTRSCVTAISLLEGTKVTTTAGLRKPGEAIPNLQRNWMEGNVAQCGYCQPGQILKAHALLQKNPDPSVEEIKAEMDNLCRCGTYPRMIEAIQNTAKDNQADKEYQEQMIEEAKLPADSPEESMNAE